MNSSRHFGLCVQCFNSISKTAPTVCVKVRQGVISGKENFTINPRNPTLHTVTPELKTRVGRIRDLALKNKSHFPNFALKVLKLLEMVSGYY